MSDLLRTGEFVQVARGSLCEVPPVMPEELCLHRGKRVLVCDSNVDTAADKGGSDEYGAVGTVCDIRLCPFLGTVYRVHLVESSATVWVSKGRLRAAADPDENEEWLLKQPVLRWLPQCVALLPDVPTTGHNQSRPTDREHQLVLSDEQPMLSAPNEPSSPPNEQHRHIHHHVHPHHHHHPHGSRNTDQRPPQADHHRHRWLLQRRKPSERPREQPGKRPAIAKEGGRGVGARRPVGISQQRSSRPPHEQGSSDLPSSRQLSSSKANERVPTSSVAHPSAVRANFWYEWCNSDTGTFIRCSTWGRAAAFLLAMRERSTDTFNIDYIIRQLETMRHGPTETEAHLLLELQVEDVDCAAMALLHPGASSGPKAARSRGSGKEAAEPLGVLAATLRSSRRCPTVEFRAVYLSAHIRRRRLASAMVYLAMEMARLVWREQWNQTLHVDLMQAWVVLPHCMQTSAKFWEGVGFALGQEVDRKETKMAMLRHASGLVGDFTDWALLPHRDSRAVSDTRGLG